VSGFPLASTTTRGLLGAGALAVALAVALAAGSVLGCAGPGRPYAPDSRFLVNSLDNPSSTTTAQTPYTGSAVRGTASGTAAEDPFAGTAQRTSAGGAVY